MPISGQQHAARGDGSYAIRGTKMWISGGDHEMSENIVHLVLARHRRRAGGVKGISMFIVPKRRLDEAGDAAQRNGVRLMGLNHKMGWRGVTNTVLSFGDDDDCTRLSRRRSRTAASNTCS